MQNKQINKWKFDKKEYLSLVTFAKIAYELQEEKNTNPKTPP